MGTNVGTAHRTDEAFADGDTGRCAPGVNGSAPETSTTSRRSSGRRWARSSAVVVAVGLAATGCSGGKGAASIAKPAASTSPIVTTTTSTTSTTSTVAATTTTTTTTVATTTTSTTSTVAATTTTSTSLTPLTEAVIAPPQGFALSHAAGARNGPMTAAELNKIMNSSTVADDTHYVDGYHAVFDSRSDNSYIEVMLADFATAEDAASFQGGFEPSATAVSVDDPAIAGADDFDSPTPNPDGSFDHGVLAAKGNRVMFIDKVTRSATRDPFVDAMAQLQYAKM
jgi:hypothetical protein